MATHSSTLAWKIPWTEEPARLQSMGSQRVLLLIHLIFATTLCDSKFSSFIDDERVAQSRLMAVSRSTG